MDKKAEAILAQILEKEKAEKGESAVPLQEEGKGLISRFEQAVFAYSQVDAQELLDEMNRILE